MNKFTKSKSSLFLMELILTILLFSICGAICMKLFAASHTLSQRTWELNKSVAAAQGFVEVMRGTRGDSQSILAMYPNAVQSGDSYFEIFYDEQFSQCDFSSSVYTALVAMNDEGKIQNMEVRVVRNIDQEEIYSLAATKYMNTNEGLDI